MRTMMRTLLCASLLACVANAGRILSTQDNADDEAGNAIKALEESDGPDEYFSCDASADPDSLSAPVCFPLLSELKEAEIGSVCIELASHNTTRIVFETSGAWTMMAAYVWGDRDRTTYPIEQGSPNLNEFPSTFRTPVAATSWEVILPLDDVVGCSPKAFQGDLVTYFILSAKVENLFDFNGPRRIEMVHGHEHWLSMTNEKGSVSRFFSYMEVEFRDVQCDCEIIPKPDNNIVPLALLPGKPTDISSEATDETTETTHQRSDEATELSNPYDTSIAEQGNMIEATEVVVGSTFTVVHHSKNERYDTLKTMLNEVFEDFVSEIMRRHQVGSTPALRRRKLSTVGVALDADSPHVYHYMTTTKCPDSVDIDGAECHDAVARYTLLIDDSASLKAVCQTFMQYTQEVLDLGLFHNSIEVAAAEESLKLSVQDVSVAYCGTAADAVITTRIIPPTASTIEVQEIMETEGEVSSSSTSSSSSGDGDSSVMMMIAIVGGVLACCFLCIAAKFFGGGVEVDTQVQNVGPVENQKNYSFEPSSGDEEIQAMTDVRVV